MLFAQAAPEKNASWLFDLFGVKTTVTNALVFIGVIIVVFTFLWAAVTMGLSGEQGKQKLKKKMPYAIIGAVLCFSGVAILDVVVSKLHNTGESIQGEKVNQILGD